MSVSFKGKQICKTVQSNYVYCGNKSASSKRQEISNPVHYNYTEIVITTRQNISEGNNKQTIIDKKIGPFIVFDV